MCSMSDYIHALSFQARRAGVPVARTRDLPTNPSWRLGRRPAGPGRRPGQAIVEFALVGSIMTLLLLGGIDLGRVFFFDVMITAAAQEGARAAALGAPDDDSSTTANGVTTTVLGVKTVARNSAPAGAVCTTCVTVSPSQAQRATGAGNAAAWEWTTVTVTYTFTPITPLMGAIWTAARGNTNPPLTRVATQRMRANCVLANENPCS